MTTPARFEPVELLRVLSGHGVAFVVVGGFAAEVQGVSWSTLDIDIVIESQQKNYVALAAALSSLDAWCLVAPGSVQRIRPTLDRIRTLRGTLMLRTRYGRLDVMKSSDSGSGGLTYSDLLADSLETAVRGNQFLVAGLPAILRMKRAANRAKDAKVIPLIEEAIKKGP